METNSEVTEQAITGLQAILSDTSAHLAEVWGKLSITERIYINAQLQGIFQNAEMVHYIVSKNAA